MKIAIASGKGGTGKTFVSTNLFYTFRSMGISVSLVDCDAEVPNALAFIATQGEGEMSDVMQYRPIINTDKCTFCGKCVEYCTYNAIFISEELKKIRLLEDLCHGCSACEFACEQDAIIESNVKSGTVTVFRIEGDKCFVEGRMETGVSSPVPVIKSAIKIGEKLQTDFMIMDSPPGTSCPFIQTVAQADYVILVTEPTPFGLSDLRHAAQALRIMNLDFGVIINRAGIGNREVYNYLEAENIRLLAEIPFDREIAKIYSEGHIVSETMPQVRSIFENIVTNLNHNGNSSNQR